MASPGLGAKGVWLIVQKRMKEVLAMIAGQSPELESYNLSPFKAVLPLLECRQVSY